MGVLVRYLQERGFVKLGTLQEFGNMELLNQLEKEGVVERVVDVKETSSEVEDEKESSASEDNKKGK